MPFDQKLYCILPSATMREASACIDGNAAKIALVVDACGRLLDTLTDGDIRRAILAGLELSTPVSRLHEGKLHRLRPPVTASVGADKVSLSLLMRDSRVRQIPLLNANGQVVDIITASDLEKAVALPVHAVIMAGGFGVRLRPLTDDLPKPMLPVGDRPLLEDIIERLHQSGIRRITILTHYKPAVITDHFGDGRAFGVNIDYVQEETPLGTAGALNLLKTGNDPLLVLNGDILTRTDFTSLFDFHREHSADITVGVREYDFRVPYGVVETNGANVTAITEKPVIRNFVNAGIYLLATGIRDHIPQGMCYDMPTLINDHVRAGKTVVSFPVHEYWLDIGHMDDYRKADADIRNGAV